MLDSLCIREYFKNKEFDLVSFLELAIGFTEVIGETHQRNRVHRSFNPESIFIHPTTKQINIKDTRNGLAYISPEQTGRIDRNVDFRSDLFSVGVILYELLTRRLPIESKDHTEYIHMLLTQIPVAPTACNQDIPIMISSIVMKCLAKAAEDRYQSAYGLKQDLEKCLQSWNKFQYIELFELGQMDISSVFQISDELVGRDHELSELTNRWDIVCQGGVESILITGPPGVGKTSLIRAMHNRFVQGKGLFISGKFDQVQRDIPYGSFVQAFKDCILNLLKEDESITRLWKEKLLHALGGNGSLMTTFIPELKLLIGDQSQLVDISPEDEQNRFRITFIRFIQAFASKEQPLMLFIDDWQWADDASKKMVRTLITDVNVQYLFMVGAIRDHENSDEFQMPLVLSELEAMGVKLMSIHPLAIEDINHMVRLLLHCDSKNSLSLAETVHHKTAGYPFFVRQLLLTLNQENLISFNSIEGCWQWDLERIKKHSVTGNVIGLLVSKFHTLDQQSKYILKLASCIGNTFDSASLSIIDNSNEDNTKKVLHSIVEIGLIAEHESQVNTFVFLHDQVQQTVYSSIEPDEKARFHYQIGKLFIHNRKTNQLSDRIFEIANHIIEGKQAIKHEAENNEFAHIHLQAAMRAKGSIAYYSAIRYIKEGLGFLGDDSWNDDYDLIYSLYLLRGDCEYIRGNFADADRCFEITISKANSPLDKAQVYLQRCIMYKYLGHYEQSAEAGLEGLRLLGLPLKSSPTKLDIVKQLILCEWGLVKSYGKDYASLPLVTNKEHEVRSSLLMYLGAATYFIKPNLMTVTMLFMLRETLKYGNTLVSPIAFGNYGVIQCVGLWNFKRGHRFGQIGLRLSDHTGGAYSKGNTYFLYGGLIHIWQKSLHTTLPYLRKAFDYNVESGNLSLAGFTAAFSILTMLSKGDSIDEVLQYTKEKLEFVIQVKDQVNINYIQFMERMLNELKSIPHPETDARHSEALSQVDNQQGVSHQLSYVIIQVQVLFLLGHYEEAFGKVSEIEPLLDSPDMMVVTPELYYYYSLLLTRRYEDVGGHEQKKLRKKLKANLTLLKKWAKGCPENYLHKYMLVLAETKRILGDRTNAASTFTKAIDLANTHQFMHNEALANELAGRFHISCGEYKLGRLHLIEAYDGYQSWGAAAVANRLKVNYDKLIYTPSIIEVNHLQNIDINSILQASQTISGEIVLENLLKKLISIVIRNAGAQRGVFILNNGEDFVIEAEGYLDEKGIEQIAVLPSIPVSYADSLPRTVINYVSKSGQYVVLHDALNEGIFTADVYIQNEQCKSIFCIPCITQGRLIGIIYLQNNIATHAFTEDLLEVVSLLSSQAAISIENARLYSQMEQQINERTKQLRQSNHEMEHMNIQLKMLEHSRKELLANISHELGTPLQSIQGYVEALLDHVYDDEVQKEKYLRLIHSNVTGVSRLVEDLFHLSKIEGGQLYFQIVKTLLCPLMTGIYHKYELEVKQSGIDFELNIDLPEDGLKSIYPQVLVDSDRLDQVIANLIHNALRYTPKGGKIRLLVMSHLKHSNDKSNADRIIIGISDNGTGIARKHLEHIFERFYKGNKPLKGKQGSGLGLFISKDIIERHRGEIWAQSIEGKGSTFYFTLPIHSRSTDSERKRII